MLFWALFMSLFMMGLKAEAASPSKLRSKLYTLRQSANNQDLLIALAEHDLVRSKALLKSGKAKLAATADKALCRQKNALHIMLMHENTTAFRRLFWLTNHEDRMAALSHKDEKGKTPLDYMKEIVKQYDEETSEGKHHSNISGKFFKTLLNSFYFQHTLDPHYDPSVETIRLKTEPRESAAEPHGESTPPSPSTPRSTDSNCWTE